MAIDFNAEPYYDDFDETKKFYRILFKPGYAVQARELTQLQTQLQDQISKFGNSVFKDGTVVLGGEKFYETDLIAISIETSYNSSLITSSQLDTFVGETIVGVNSQVEGFVRKVVFGDTNHILLVKVTSGTNFEDGENVSISANPVATLIAANAVSPSILFSVKSGIFYVNGHFVWTDAQSIVVDTTTNNSSWSLGFVVNETAITSDDEYTLLDNAQGSFNYAAPGADRYSIDLVLTSKGINDQIDSFIELARVQDGQYIIREETTIYSELGKEFARRTYDESGDYTVSNFKLTFKDHIGGDSTKLTAALDPGKAYIKGYEFTTRNQNYLTVDRARTTSQTAAEEIYTTYGNYVYVSNLFGSFTTNAASDPYSTVELHNVARASVVDDTTKIGTARVRFLKYDSGDIGTSGAVYKMYLFDIQIDSGKFFKDVESITIGATTPSSGANIDLLSKTDGISGGDVTLSGADRISLVFPMNQKYIETVKDEDDLSKTGYTIQRTFTTNFTPSGSNCQGTITTNNGLERFFGGVGAYGDDVKRTHYHVVVTSVTSGSQVAVGDVLDFTESVSGNARTISGGSVVTGSTQTVTLDAKTATTAFTATVVATINVDAQTERTKTLSNYVYKVISSPSTTQGGKNSLGYADGYELLAVYNTGTTDPTTQLATTGKFNATTGAIIWDSVAAGDATVNYTFDDGQRDDVYDHANIILNGTAPGASDYLVAVFKYFTHSGSNGYLTVDSYSGMAYEDIPTFTSPTSRNVYELRDCFDFRPRRADGATTLNFGQVPDPSFPVTADYRFYLPRKDRILATAGRAFEVKQGIPSQVPLAPDQSSDGMTLYVITVPPYTANLNDIQVQYVDNRRYTMRDIGKIEKRVVNIEYYTQLSLLEKQAQDESIPDASSIEKFKNGILVDAFAGHTVGDVVNPDYRCAIDLQRRELRSFGEIYNLGVGFDSGTNTTRKGDLVTLDYTEDVFAEQPFATKAININPFNVVSFIGTINLEPSQDIWVDTVTLPPLNVTSEVNITVNAFQPIVVRPRPIWNWGFGWGVNNWGWGGWGWGWWNGWNTGSWGGWNGNWGGVGQTWTEGRRVMRNELVTTTTVEENTESLGTSVVDLQFLPFIRQRTIIGVANGLKPNTRHWAYMDETNVSVIANNYVRPLTKVVISNTSGPLFDASLGVYETLTFSAGGTARVALVSPESSGTRTLWVFNVSGTISGSTTVSGENSNSADVDLITTYNLGDAVYTDTFGLVAFEFQIPGGRFRTGERKVRLIDNVDNDTSSTESSGETTYFALGQLKTEQETLLTTRTITNTQTVEARQIGWADPLAQSFLVDSNVYPNGVHLSSIDLYFRTKSSNIPVTLEIRKMVNGYPEAVSSIAFGSTSLFPESISISESSIVPTKFTFPSTVYLPPDEYCFVLLANSNEYEVWVAEMGKTLWNTDGVRMTQQPYAGSLFKSQNSTTWTAVQEEDIKFAINRCVFEASGTADFIVEEAYSYSSTGNISGTTISNIPAETFFNIGTGMLITGTGIPTNTTVTAVSFNGGSATTGSITISNSATTGTGIELTFYAVLDYGLMNINSSIISPSNTNISLSVKTLDKGTGLMDSSYINVVNKKDYEFASIKKVIPSSLNGNVSPILIQATMSSTSDAVSPAVDSGRFGVTLVKNVINNDSTGEDGIVGGNAISKYITKSVTLADGFDASNLVVSFDAYKPFGSNIKVYYKTLPIEKTTPINDESWVEMEIENSVENSVDTLDYKEHRFFPVDAFDEYGVPGDNPISPRFNSFAIKIVMLSNNEALAPRIRDFRTIALYN